MKTLYLFKKSNICLYEPRANIPEQPLFSVVSSNIETAIKGAEVATGLSVNKGQMTVSMPMLSGANKGNLSEFVWRLYFRSFRTYLRVYHIYLSLTSKQ
jgi:hypothetical protein